MDHKLRVGVVGVRRGFTLARECQMVGMDVVAVCDLDRLRLSRACDALGAVGYQDYDAFLAHDMEGVILANSFDERTGANTISPRCEQKSTTTIIAASAALPWCGSPRRLKSQFRPVPANRAAPVTISGRRNALRL